MAEEEPSGVSDWATTSKSAFKRVDPRRLAPGAEILIASEAGGYLPESGWAPHSSEHVEPVAVPASLRHADAELERASNAEDDDALSELEAWKTIAVHGREAGEHALAIARELGLERALADLLALAGRWHDAGKAHDVFQDAIKEAAGEAGGPGRHVA